jgi:hypothetical protein
MSEEKKKSEPKLAVVTLGDYITKVGNDGKLAGQDKRKAALVLLYSENKVIAREESKGETYYIVEK